MKTYIIGDIHGGYKALEQVFKRAGITNNDRIICLGDYVDRWNESKHVLDFLINFNNNSKGNNIFIRGNHDQWFIDFINGQINGRNSAESIWVNQGGKATLLSYNSHIQPTYSGYKVDVEIPDEHIEFLNNTILYYIDDKNRGFVHAGYESHDGLGNDEDFVYMWDRELAYMLPMRTSDPVPKLLRPHDELYIGHTTTLQWKTTEPINLHNKYWNLDTGGGWSGKITAMDLDTKEYWQSDFVKDLYPNIKSR